MTETVGRVVELWRYPVKSLGGERLRSVECEHRGLEGDRRWAVRGMDGKLGSGKTTRRFRRMPGLLTLSSFVDEAGRAWIRFPDGEARRVDDATTPAWVGAVVGEEVTVVAEGETPHFDDSALHLVSSASLAWLHERRPHDQVDRRRFRPNVVLEVPGASGRVEEAWVGRTLEIGTSVLTVVRPTERCVMTTLAQGELSFAPRILKELAEASEALLGVYAEVAVPGALRVGDPVSLRG